MVIGNDDPGAFQIDQHIAGDDLAVLVVAVGVVRLEHPQAVFDRQARRHDQETAREFPAAWLANGINRLPGNEH